MALSTMEENIMQLAGRGGAGNRYGAYPYYQAANERKLATRRYKESRDEDTRRYEIGRTRTSELDALNEELERAILALNQATSGRADTSAEMGRIGSFYGSATPEGRLGTREDLIGRGLIPPSLRNELMIDPRRDTSRDAYPAAQAGLYPQSGGTTYGFTGLTPSRSLYDIQNASRTTPSRIVNAPPGTPSNRRYAGLLNSRSAPIANTNAAKSGDRSSLPRGWMFPESSNLGYTQQELWDIDARAMYQYNASKGVSQDMMRRSYEAGGQTMKNGKLPPGVTPMTNMWGTGSDLRM